MNLRRFPIQAAALGLSATTGCTPAIVGDWDMKSWKIDGVGMSFHYTYYGYQVDTTVEMSIDKDLEGSFDWNTIIQGYGSYSMDGDVECEADGSNKWKVTITVDSEDLDLDCTVDKDDMSCEGDSTDGTDHEMEWERDE